MVRSISKSRAARSSDVFGRITGCMLCAAVSWQQVAPVYAQVIVATDNTTDTVLTSVGANEINITTKTTFGSTAYNHFSQFNVNAGQTVNLIQPTAMNSLVNVINGANPTTINGTLNALKEGGGASNVYLLDHNGFVVGSNGAINAQQLTLSTSSQAFGQSVLSEALAGSGSTVARLFGGTEDLASAAEINVYGRINAQQLDLRSGARMILDGTIVVEDLSAGDTTISVVNTNGVPEANSVTVEGGTIRFGAGAGEITSETGVRNTETIISGTIEARRGTGGGTGGQIQGAVVGELTITATGALDVDGDTTNDAGSVLLFVTGSTVTEAGSRIRANAVAGDGGFIFSQIGFCQIGEPCLKADPDQDSGILAGEMSAGSVSGTAGAAYVTGAGIRIGNLTTFGGDLIVSASSRITLETTSVITSRNIAPQSDEATGASLGASGDVVLSAPDIVLEANAKIYAQGGINFDGGLVALVARQTETANFWSIGNEGSAAKITLDGNTIDAGAIVVTGYSLASNIVGSDDPNVEEEQSDVFEDSLFSVNGTASIEAAIAEVGTFFENIPQMTTDTIDSIPGLLPIQLNALAATTDIQITNSDLTADGNWKNDSSVLTNLDQTNIDRGIFETTGLAEGTLRLMDIAGFDFTVRLPADIDLASDSLFIHGHAATNVDVAPRAILIGASLSSTTTKARVSITNSQLTTTAGDLTVRSTVSENLNVELAPSGAGSKISIGLVFAAREIENQTLIQGRSISSAGTLDVGAFTAKNHLIDLRANAGTSGKGAIAIVVDLGENLTEAALSGSINTAGDLNLDAETLYIGKIHEVVSTMGLRSPESAERKRLVDAPILNLVDQVKAFLTGSDPKEPRDGRSPEAKQVGFGFASTIDVAIERDNTYATLGGQYHDLDIGGALVTMGTTMVASVATINVNAVERFARLVEGGTLLRRDIASKMGSLDRTAKLLLAAENAANVVAGLPEITQAELVGKYGKAVFLNASLGIMGGETQAEIGSNATITRATALNVNALTSYPGLDSFDGLLTQYKADLDQFVASIDDFSLQIDLAEADVDYEAPEADALADILGALNPLNYLTTNTAAKAEQPTAKTETTSETQSLAVAITLNYFQTENTTRAVIRDGAQINIGNTAAVQIDALQQGVFLHLVNRPSKVPGKVNENVNDAVGGAVNVVRTTSTVEALIEDNVTIVAGDVTVDAHTKTVSVDAVYAGGSGSKTVINAAFGISSLETDTIARVGGAASITGEDVLIKALDDSILVGVAGAISGSNNVAAGASINVNFVFRTVYAGIGPSSLTGPISGTTGDSVIDANTLTIDAKNDAIELSITIAGAKVTDKPKTDPLTPGDGDPTGPDADDDIPSDDETFTPAWLLSDIEELELEEFKSYSTPADSTGDSTSTDDAEKDGKSQKSGWAIAGAASLNLMLNNEVITEIATNGQVILRGDVNQTAANSSLTIAVAGALSASFAKEKNANAMAGAFAVTVDERDVISRLRGVTVDAVNLTVLAEDTSDLVGVAVGGAGKSKSTDAGGANKDLAMAGSVVVNVVTGTTQTLADHVTLISDEAVTLNSSDSAFILAVGGAAGINMNMTEGSGAGIGVAVNAIDRTAQTTVTGLSRITANSVQALSTTNAEIFGFAVSVGAGKTGVSGSVAVNTLAGGARTNIGNLAGPIVVISAVTLNVQATESNEIWSLAGGVAVGKEKALGGAITVNTITSLTEATVENTTVQALSPNASLGAVTVAADSDSDIGTLAAAGALGLTGDATSVGVGLSGNYISVTTRASMADTVVTDAASVTASANNERRIRSLGGGLSFSAGKSGGFAATVNLILGNTTEVDLNNADISTRAGGSITATATSDAEIKSIALAISASSKTSIGGSATANATTALTQVSADGATLDAAGTLKLEAIDLSDIGSLAGGAAVSFSGSGLGAAIAVNIIAHETNVFVRNDATLTSNGAIDLLATNDADIQSAAVGLAATAGTTLSGSIAVGYIGNRTSVILDNPASVNSSGGNLTLNATKTSQIDILAGAISIGKGTAAGGAVTVAVIQDQVQANLNLNRELHVGDVNVLANGNSEINAIAVAASGSIGSAFTGSLVYAQIGKPTAEESSAEQADTSDAVKDSMEEGDSLRDGALDAIGERLEFQQGNTKFTTAGSYDLTREDAVSARVRLDGADVGTLTSLNVRAEEDASISTLAGAVAFGKSNAGGAALAVNLLFGTTVADLTLTNGQPTTLAGNVNVTANQIGALRTLAVAGAIGGSSAIAGSIIVNVFDRQADAKILSTAGNSTNTKLRTLGGDVLVRATQNDLPKSAAIRSPDDFNSIELVGSFPAAPDDNIAGRDYVDIRITGAKIADFDPETVLNSEINLKYDRAAIALDEGRVPQLISVSSVDDTFVYRFFLSTALGDESTFDKLSLTVAPTKGSIDSLAGAIAIGFGAVGGGAAVTVTILSDDALALIESVQVDTTLENETETAGAGSIEIIAANAVDLTAIAVAAGGAANVAISGSFAINLVNSKITARADKANLIGHSVTVDARATNNLGAYAGALAVSGSVAIGVGIIANVASMEILADVNASRVRVGGNVTVNARAKTTMGSTAVAGGFAGSVSITGTGVGNASENIVMARVSDDRPYLTPTDLQTGVYQDQYGSGTGGLLAAGSDILANGTVVVTASGETIIALKGGKEDEVAPDAQTGSEDEAPSLNINISGGGAVGIGAAVNVNKTANQITALVSRQSSIVGLGNMTADVETVDGTTTTKRGVYIGSYGITDLSQFTAAGSAGGSLSILAALTFNLVDDNVQVIIGSNDQRDSTQINRDLSIQQRAYVGAGAAVSQLQNTELRADILNEIESVTAGVSLSGGIGGAAAATTNLISSQTKIATNRAYLNARNDLTIAAKTSNELDIWLLGLAVGGTFGGSIGLDLNIIDSKAKVDLAGSILSAGLTDQGAGQNRYFDGDIQVLADVDTDITTVVGNLAGGAVGVAGSVIVNVLETESSVTLSNIVGARTSIRAAGTLDIVAGTTNKTDNIVAAAGGGIGAVAFGMNIDLIESKTSVKIGSNQQLFSAGNMNVNAIERLPDGSDPTINGRVFFLAIGAGAGGFTFNYIKYAAATTVEIGDGATLETDKNLTVAAQANRWVDSMVVGGALGALAGTLGVSIIEMGGVAKDETDGELAEALDDVQDTLKEDRADGGNMGDLIGQAGSTGAKTAITDSTNSVTVTGDTGTDNVKVTLGSGSSLLAGQNLTVDADIRARVKQRSGSAAIGLVGGGSISVIVSLLESQSVVVMGSGVTLAANDNISVNAKTGGLGTVGLSDNAVATNTITVSERSAATISAKAIAITAGGAGAVAGTVVVSNANSTAKIIAGGSLTVRGKNNLTAGSVTFDAIRTDTVLSEIGNITVGGVGIGATYATSKSTGTSEITLGDANVSTMRAESVSLTTNDKTTAFAASESATGGILAIGVTQADATNTGTSKITLRSVEIDADRDVFINAFSEARALTLGRGLSVGIAAVGATIAKSDVNATVAVDLSSAVVEGQNIYINTLLSNASGRNSYAKANSASGGLVAGNGAETNAYLDYTVTTNLDGTFVGRNNLLIQSAVNGASARGKVVGLSIGAVAIGAVVNRVGQTATENTSGGTDIQTSLVETNLRSGNFTSRNNLSVVAVNNANVSMDTTSGSGGLISGSGADAETTSSLSTRVTTGSSGKVILLAQNTVTVTAGQASQLLATLDNTSGSLIGASGATTKTLFQSRLETIIGQNTEITGAEINLLATNNIVRPNQAYNIKSASGGAIDVAAMSSSVSMVFTTNLAILQGSKIIQLGDRFTDKTVNIGLVTDLTVYDKLVMDAGGLVAAPRGTSRVTIQQNTAELTLEGATILAQGELNIYNGGNTDIRADVNATAYGLAGAPGADSYATYNARSEININAGTRIESENNVYVRAGYVNDTRQTVNLRAESRSFNKTAIPIPGDPDADAEAVTTSSLNINSGAQLTSVKDIYLAADGGDRSIVGYGRAKDLYREAAAAVVSVFSNLAGGGDVSFDTISGSSIDSSGNDGIVVNGKVRAGSRSQRFFEVNTAGQILDAAGEVLSLTEYLALDDAMEVQVLEDVNVASELADRITVLQGYIGNEILNKDATAVAAWQSEIQNLRTRQGEASEQIADKFIFGDLSASEGNINMRADFVQGGATGELNAPGNARISIKVLSGDIVSTNALLISSAEGGRIVLNDVLVTDESDLRIQSADRAGIYDLNLISGSDAGKPLIEVITNSLNPSEKSGYIRLNGEVSNLRGTVSVKSNTGDIDLDGNISAETIIVEAAGDVTIGYVPGVRNIASDPVAQYRQYFDEFQNVMREVLVALDFAEGTGSDKINANLKFDVQLPPPSQGVLRGGKNVYITADTLNINGLIQAGTGTYDVNIGAGLDAELLSYAGTTDRILLHDTTSPEKGGLAVDTFDITANTNVRVYYNGATKKVEIDDMVVRGGKVRIFGNIISTGNGRIEALDGYGQINVTSAANADVVLQRIDLGDATTGGLAGSVRIEDTSKLTGNAASPYLITEYLRENGVIKVFTNINSDGTEAIETIDVFLNDPNGPKATEVSYTITRPANLLPTIDGRVTTYDPTTNRDLVILKTETYEEVYDTNFSQYYFWVPFGVDTDPPTSVRKDVSATPTEGETAPYVTDRLAARSTNYSITAYSTERELNTVETDRDDNRTLGIGTVRWTRTTTLTASHLYENRIKADQSVKIVFNGADAPQLFVQTAGNVILSNTVVNTLGNTSIRSTRGNVVTANDNVVLVGGDTQLIADVGTIGSAERAFRTRLTDAGKLTLTAGQSINLRDLDGDLNLALAITSQRASAFGDADVGNIKIVAEGSILDANSSPTGATINGTNITLISQDGSVGDRRRADYLAYWSARDAAGGAAQTYVLDPTLEASLRDGTVSSDGMTRTGVWTDEMIADFVAELNEFYTELNMQTAFDEDYASNVLRIDTQAGGVVNVQAKNDIVFAEISGDLGVDTIVSAQGSVMLTVLDGALLDRNDVETKDLRTLAELETLWESDLDLYGANAANRVEGQVTNLETRRQADYQVYWTARNAAGDVAQTFIFDQTLEASLRRGVLSPDGVTYTGGWTEKMIADYLAEQNAFYQILNAQSAFDENYIYTVTAQDRTNVTQGGTWTSDELVRSLNANLVRTTGDTNTRDESANVSAFGDITFITKNGAGELLDPYIVTQGGDNSDASTFKTLTNLDLEKIYTAERSEILITADSVSIEQKEDFNFAFTGQSTGRLRVSTTNDAIFLSAETSAVLANIEGVANVQIKIDGSLTENLGSGDLEAVTGRLIVLESGNDSSIGTPTEAVSVTVLDGGSLTARSGKDVSIISNVRDLPIAEIFAGGTARLTSMGAITDAGGLGNARIVADNIELSARSIGTAANPFGVRLADTQTGYLRLTTYGPNADYPTAGDAFVTSTGDLRLKASNLFGGGKLTASADSKIILDDTETLIFGTPATLTLEARGGIDTATSVGTEVTGGRLIVNADAALGSLAKPFVTDLVAFEFAAMTFGSTTIDTSVFLSDLGDLETVKVTQNNNPGSQSVLSAFGNIDAVQIASKSSTTLTTGGSIGSGTITSERVVIKAGGAVGDIAALDVILASIETESVDATLINFSGRDVVIDQMVVTGTGALTVKNLTTLTTLKAGGLGLQTQQGAIRGEFGNFRMNEDVTTAGGQVWLSASNAFEIADGLSIQTNGGLQLVTATGELTVGDDFAANTSNGTLTITGGLSATFGKGATLNAGTGALEVAADGQLEFGDDAMLTNANAEMRIIGQVDLSFGQNAKLTSADGTISVDSRSQTAKFGDQLIATAQSVSINGFVATDIGSDAKITATGSVPGDVILTGGDLTIGKTATIIVETGNMIVRTAGQAVIGDDLTLTAQNDVEMTIGAELMIGDNGAITATTGTLTLDVTRGTKFGSRGSLLTTDMALLVKVGEILTSSNGLQLSSGAGDMTVDVSGTTLLGEGARLATTSGNQYLTFGAALTAGNNVRFVSETGQIDLSVSGNLGFGNAARIVTRNSTADALKLTVDGELSFGTQSAPSLEANEIGAIATLDIGSISNVGPVGVMTRLRELDATVRAGDIHFSEADGLIINTAVAQSGSVDIYSNGETVVRTVSAMGGSETVVVSAQGDLLGDATQVNGNLIKLYAFGGKIAGVTSETFTADTTSGAELWLLANGPLNYEETDGDLLIALASSTTASLDLNILNGAGTFGVLGAATDMAITSRGDLDINVIGAVSVDLADEVGLKLADTSPTSYGLYDVPSPDKLTLTATNLGAAINVGLASVKDEVNLFADALNVNLFDVTPENGLNLQLADANMQMADIVDVNVIGDGPRTVLATPFQSVRLPSGRVLAPLGAASSGASSGGAVTISFGRIAQGSVTTTGPALIAQDVVIGGDTWFRQRTFDFLTGVEFGELDVIAAAQALAVERPDDAEALILSSDPTANSGEVGLVTFELFDERQLITERVLVVNRAREGVDLNGGQGLIYGVGSEAKAFVAPLLNGKSLLGVTALQFQDYFGFGTEDDEDKVFLPMIISMLEGSASERVR